MQNRKIVDVIEYETLISSENKALVKEFLTEKKSQRKTPTTIEQYNGDMRIILTMLYRHFDNKLLTELTRKDIRNLSIIFQERGLSNARVNRLMSCLRSALEHFADDDETEYEFNQGARVKGLPKDPIREITFLTETQIEWLTATLIERDELLIAVYLNLSYCSAARKNEVYQVLKDGLTERYFTNTVIGKRQKKFKLYYNEVTRQLIDKYLEQRGYDEIPQLFVKVFKTGEKRLVHKATFNYWCEIMARLLGQHEGKPIHINPHCFRHSRLENLNRSGIPIEKLKTLANHSDISTTASYLAERSEEDIADIFGMDASDFK